MCMVASPSEDMGPMVPAPYRVRGRVQETPDTWTLELEPANGHALAESYRPGQFNMVYAFGVGEVPVSISGSTDGGALLHTVRDVGPVTRAICAVEPGAMLGLRGPFGSAWPLEVAEGRDLVVVAGGLGLAPLRSALVGAIEAAEGFRSIHLLYGGREPEQLLYLDEIREWAPRGLRAEVTVDTATGSWTGDVGVVTKLIDRAEFEPADAVALVCGPEVMMRFAARALGARGVTSERVYISMERNMKCAVTHCGRCQFGPTFVCREGPVMRLADIDWIFGLPEV
jgi:NAD(P)H-flavin reductase